jgi:hypothetical protein
MSNQTSNHAGSGISSLRSCETSRNPVQPWRVLQRARAAPANAHTRRPGLQRVASVLCARRTSPPSPSKLIPSDGRGLRGTITSLGARCQVSFTVSKYSFAKPPRRHSCESLTWRFATLNDRNNAQPIDDELLPTHERVSACCLLDLLASRCDSKREHTIMIL